MPLEKATFAAGCFWGVQNAFDKVEGVVKTVVGYTGGHTENPSYKEVCGDKTGHAEAIEIMFDSSKVSYEKLLEIFFSIHDPTEFNRQGPDTGSQYRSAIFYHSLSQKDSAEKTIYEEQKKYKKKIATEIVPAHSFYPAEEYHQKYYRKKQLFNCVAGILSKNR